MENEIKTAVSTNMSSKTASQENIDKIVSQIAPMASKSIQDAIAIGVNALELATAEKYHQGIRQAAMDLADIYIRRMRNLTEGDKYLAIVQDELAKEFDIRIELRRQMTIATKSTLQADYLEAVNLFLKVEEQLIELGDQYLLAVLYSGLGAVYFFLFKLEDALEYHLKSLKLYEDQGYYIGVANCNNNIANIIERLGDHEKSIEHLMVALEMFEKVGDNQGIARANGNISLMYNNMEQYDKALEYGLKALEQARANNNEMQIALVLNNVGEIFKMTKRYEEALEYYFQSLEIAEKLKMNLEIAVAANNIGECYSELSRYDDMVKYLDYALPIIHKCNALVLLKNNHYIRSIYAYNQKDFEQALDYLVKYMEVKEKIFTEETARKTSEMTTIFKVEKMEQEKEIYRLKNVELVNANRKLQEALDNIKVLSGLVPICSHCKKIRDDKGFWNHLETYISQHSEATFSHGICPDCLNELYPDVAKQIKKDRQKK